jgi:formate hydrogenlyase subunit 3/multisubunit Na+/H+ antiporter MnhD subunit
MRELLLHPFVQLILFPAIAGMVCLLAPKRLYQACAWFAVLTSGITLCLAWPVYKSREILDFGSWLSLRADNLSVFVVLGVAFFGLVVCLYSIGFMKGKERLGEFYGYLLLTIGMSCGAVLANELILMLVFWGGLAATLYMMIGLAGPSAAAASRKTFIVIGASDSAFVLGVALIWVVAGTTRLGGAPLVLHGWLSYAAFACLVIAAFAKAGAMPLHSWIPDCGEKAPVPVVAFLPASLDKLLGIYLLVRTTTGIFAMNGSMNLLLMAAGAITILFAVMMALVQHDLKRLLSYHAVSQVGYMVLGIGTGTALGIAGGLFHMLNNAIYKTCLFLCAGAVEKRAGTTDLDSLGGLAKTMPVTFVACVVSALSISGIPPLNGFASKWMVYQGIVDSGKSGGYLWVVWLSVAMLGSALTLASFVKVLHAVFLRKASPSLAAKKASEVGPAMWLPMALLALLSVVFGIAAFRLPLKYLVFPAVNAPVALVGIWWAGPATLMLAASLAAGIAIYFLSTVRKARAAETYVGGEVLNTVYLSGETAEGPRDIEVSGTGFYETVQHMRFFAAMYAMAKKRFFDFYDVSARFISYFVRVLREAHNGVLPLYLTWVMAGILIVLSIVIGTGR